MARIEKKGFGSLRDSQAGVNGDEDFVIDLGLNSASQMIEKIFLSFHPSSADFADLAGYVIYCAAAIVDGVPPGETGSASFDPLDLSFVDTSLNARIIYSECFAWSPNGGLTAYERVIDMEVAAGRQVFAIMSPLAIVKISDGSVIYKCGTRSFTVTGKIYNYSEKMRDTPLGKAR